MSFGEGKCRSCQALVLWVKTAAGRNMPLDAMPGPAGNIERMFDGEVWHGRVVPTAQRGGRMLYTSHHSTCPQATQWRVAR
jgi:hypothetical protein